MKQDYEVLTDNYPRKRPLGKGATVSLTEQEAEFSILSGDVALVKDKPKKSVTAPIVPPAGEDK
jgi:hypothetical protein